MAQVTIAKGGVWVKPLPQGPLTEASQAVLARYMHQAKLNPRLELRAYLASGALGIHNPLADNKATPKGARLGNTLGAIACGVSYTLNQRGNATPKASKVRAFVCHNISKKKV